MTALDDIYNEVIDRPATPSASLALIKILKKEGKPDKVIEACRKVLEFFPDDINIRRLLAETYSEQGLTQLAGTELEILHKQISGLSSVFKFQAELFKKEGRVEEAINSLKLYMAHHGSDKEAAKLLSELSSAHKEEPSALPTSTLAEIYYKQGELEDAIKIYEQVVKASPDDEKPKTRLKELKERKEAEEHRETEEGILEEKKFKLIGILERWLADIERRRSTGLSVQL